MTKYESEIIYHRKKKCKGTSDSEDNADDKADRRTSTRVRKRKFFYGYDDGTDSKANDGPKVDSDVAVDVNPDVNFDVDPDLDPVEPKKKATDEDFVLTDETSSDSDESNDIRVKYKDRSKPRKCKTYCSTVLQFILIGKGKE